MKFIAQITGQRLILADGTAYKAIGRTFDVREEHAAEVAGMGFIASEAPAKKAEAPKDEEEDAAEVADAPESQPKAPKRVRASSK